MISMHEAAKQGVTKLRQPQWAAKGDHIEIHIADQAKGQMGPWVKFYAEHPVEGMTNPQSLLITGFNTEAAEWEPSTQATV